MSEIRLRRVMTAVLILLLVFVAFVFISTAFFAAIFHYPTWEITFLFLFGVQGGAQSIAITRAEYFYTGRR